MDKRKRSPDSIWHNKFLRILLFLTVTPVVCFGCTLSLYFGLSGYIGAYIHLYKMTGWEIPPESRYVDFAIEDASGGTSCFVIGRLVIESNLPEEQLTEFYRSHYGKNYWGGVDPITAYEIDNSPDGKHWYRISALKNWNCP